MNDDELSRHTNPRDFFVGPPIRELGGFTVGESVIVTSEQHAGACGWVRAVAPNVWDDSVFVKVVLPEVVLPHGHADMVFVHTELAHRLI